MIAEISTEAALFPNVDREFSFFIRDGLRVKGHPEPDRHIFITSYTRDFIATMHEFWRQNKFDEITEYMQRFLIELESEQSELYPLPKIIVNEEGPQCIPYIPLYARYITGFHYLANWMKGSFKDTPQIGSDTFTCFACDMDTLLRQQLAESNFVPIGAPLDEPEYMETVDYYKQIFDEPYKSLVSQSED